VATPVTAPSRRRGTRALAAAHGAQAAVLLAAPSAVLGTVVGDRGVPPSWIVRVLGGRTLAQATLEAAHPTRDVVRLGIAVDLAHAVTMLLAARIWPRYRRAALASAGTAASSAAVGALLVKGPR
jgi:hypothetical protein